jgi:putative ribosome biogenesis GTPase RsgA
MKLSKYVLEIIESTESLDDEFENILELSMKCKFSNCTHTTEPNCAVKKAISEGILSEERFNNYYRVKNEAKYVSEQKNKTKAVDYMKKLKLFEKPY